MPRVIAVVPARKGSTRIPGKNMKRLAGSPLIVWTLEALTSSRLVEHAVVSSDDPNLLALAGLYAKVATVWRTEELAGPDVPDLPVIVDAMNRCPFHFAPDDVVLLLRPTAPFRRPEEIDLVADMLLAQPQVDSIRSVIRAKHHPQKAYLWSERTLIRYTSDHRANHPSQGLDPVCYPTGFIDAMRPKHIWAGELEGTVIKPWLSPPLRAVDLDTEEDWAEAEALAKAHNWGPGRIHQEVGV